MSVHSLRLMGVFEPCASSHNDTLYPQLPIHRGIELISILQKQKVPLYYIQHNAYHTIVIQYNSDCTHVQVCYIRCSLVLLQCLSSTSGSVNNP